MRTLMVVINQLFQLFSQLCQDLFARSELLSDRLWSTSIFFLVACGSVNRLALVVKGIPLFLGPLTENRSIYSQPYVSKSENNW